MNSTRQEVAEAHARYLDSLGDALVRLSARWESEGKRQLDGSVESLRAVGELFYAQVAKPTLRAPDDWLPAWWDPESPVSMGEPSEARPLSRDQLMLIDEVQAYYADVVLSHAPEARWGIYKGSKKDWRNGESVIHLTNARNTSPSGLVYSAAIRVVLLGKSESSDLFYEIAKESIAIANS